MTQHPPLVVFGGGSMGSAIVRAGVDREILDPMSVTVCEPDARKRKFFDDYGVLAVAGHSEACAELGDDGVIMLAVKPQSFGELTGQLRSALAEKSPEWSERGSVVSIMAGVPISTFADALGVARTRAVRVMPNVGASVYESMTAICAAAGADEELLGFVTELFRAIGETIEIPEERMDAFTALAGSGPAYLFYLAEAMIEAGERCGFSREESDRIARRTLRGATELLEDEETSPAEFRARVTSKGGTTEAAIGVLDAKGVREAIVRAIEEGAERARQLSTGQ